MEPWDIPVLVFCAWFRQVKGLKIREKVSIISDGQFANRSC